MLCSNFLSNVPQKLFWCDLQDAILFLLDQFSIFSDMFQHDIKCNIVFVFINFNLHHFVAVYIKAGTTDKYQIEVLLVSSISDRYVLGFS